MPQLLLVNPSPRKGKTMAKAKRSAAQIRATRKLVALNKARRKVSHAKPHRRSNPIHAVAHPAPKRRKYKRTTASAARVAGRTLRHRRRNPIGGIGGFFKETLIPSAVGGAGALTLDVLLGVLPVPAQFRTGPMASVVKIAGAIGLGLIATKVGGRKVGGQVAAGAVTVALYNLAKTTLNQASGGKIPGLAEYVPDYGQVGQYVGMYPQEALGYTGTGYPAGELMPDGSVAGFDTGVYR